MKSLVLSVLFSALAIAGPLGGPQPGFVLDARTGAIRPILGMPGAMLLGSPLSLGFPVASVDFDPNGAFAVAISLEQPPHAYLIQNLSAPAVTDLGAVVPQTAVLSVNSAGTSALLAAPGQLQFVTGIGASPTLGTAVPTVALLGPVTAATLDLSGNCALLGTASGGVGALESLCTDGTSQRYLTQAGMNVSALALSTGGQDLLFADTGGQQVSRLANYTQNSAVTTLATATDGLDQPIGIQVFGQRAIIADSSASALFVIDLTGQSPNQSFPVSIPPSRAKLLWDPSILLLNDPTAAVFSIFDLQAMQSFFVPTN